MGETLNNIFNDVSFALNLHTEALVRLQEQAATGSRINRPSDAPSDGYRVLSLDSQTMSLDNYIDNLFQVASMLEMSYSVIENMTSAFQDMRADLTQFTSGIYGQSQRESAAEKVNEMLEQIVSLANFKHMNQYLFGGSDTASAPYLVGRTGGDITSVTYQGSTEGLNVDVAAGVQSSAFYIGDDIFRSDSRETPVFLGNTGAVPGGGTSNVQGYTWLTIADESPTEYKLSIDGGTNNVIVDKGKSAEVQTLAFSAVPTSGSFTLTFDGQKTAAIQWDEGAAEVETALEALSNLSATDVAVTGSYAAGFTITFADTLGNVPELVPGDNTLANGGAVTITPNTTTQGVGNTRLAVTNPDGRVLYVNTTGIVNTGVELVSVSGAHDIFNSLITIRDILKNENNFSDARVLLLLEDSLDSLEEISNLLVQNSVATGSRIAFLEDLKGSLNNLKYGTEDEAVRLQEADIAQIAIDLSRRELLYQMSLSLAARIMSVSLLDFI
jgi:flagellar hook-associated protein 3